MQKILQLSPEVIAQIAAGEVIERPVFAVKELIENAVDAHATFIEIQAEDAGLSLLKVSDNGEGMSKEDLLLCYLPHTTSKLRGDEILGIQTLGFRGEAISSLASISDLTIYSRTSESSEGWTVSLIAGKPEEIQPVGIPKGTIVEVRNLFGHVPARLKFLKSPATEFRAITELVTKFALSFPQIHFILKHNTKTIIDIPPRDSILDRLKSLLGVSLIDQLIPVSDEESYITIEGFIGAPQVSLKYNQKQYLFVNNRPVSDRMISLAVKEAYGILLPNSHTPIFLLYLKIPFELLDVNIHPRKEQIAFVNEKLVFDAVKLAVTTSLKEHNISYSLGAIQHDSLRKGETTSYSATLLKKNEKIRFTTLSDSIFQVADTYIVTPLEGKLVLIDQHAAHERILYETYKRLFLEDKQKGISSALENTLSISLSVVESDLVSEYQDELRSMGFEFSLTPEPTIHILKIPQVFRGRNIEKIIRDMISDIEHGQRFSTVDSRSQRMLSFLACRSAVMAGETLSISTMSHITTDLFALTPNETCPHGRPTYIPLTRDELDHAFKRK